MKSPSANANLRHKPGSASLPYSQVISGDFAFAEGEKPSYWWAKVMCGYPFSVTARVRGY